MKSAKCKPICHPIIFFYGEINLSTISYMVKVFVANMLVAEMFVVKSLSLSLNMLDLKCLWDIQVEMSRRLVTRSMKFWNEISTVDVDFSIVSM